MQISARNFSVKSLAASCITLIISGCNLGNIDGSMPNYGMNTLTRNWKAELPEGYGMIAIAGDQVIGGNTRSGTTRLGAMSLISKGETWSSDIEVERDTVVNTSIEGKIYTLSGQRFLAYDLSGAIIRDFKYTTEDVTIGYGTLGPYTTPTHIYFVENSTVYAYSLAALKDANPQPTWTRTFSGTINALHVAADDTAYVGMYSRSNEHLIALNSVGEVLWSRDTRVFSGSQVIASTPEGIALQDGLLIVTIMGGRMRAFDRHTGEPRWTDWSRIDLCPEGYGSTAGNSYPVIAQDTVFLNQAGGYCVLALDLYTGKQKWAFSPPYEVTFGGKPLYHNGVIYTANGRVWALDATTGKALAVSAELNRYAADTNPLYYPAGNEVIVWGSFLEAFKPVR